jgi:hypothetical protein
MSNISMLQWLTLIGYYDVKDSNGVIQPDDSRKLWTVAGVNKVWTNQLEQRPYCTGDDLSDSDRYDDCALPVLFHRPTAMQVLDFDNEDRNVKILAHASGSSFIASENMDANDPDNAKPGGNNYWIDYPNGLSWYRNN